LRGNDAARSTIRQSHDVRVVVDKRGHAKILCARIIGPWLAIVPSIIVLMMGQTQPEAARTALRQAADGQSDFPGKEEVKRRLVLLGRRLRKASEASENLTIGSEAVSHCAPGQYGNIRR
jgi:hypothetical protein